LDVFTLNVADGGCNAIMDSGVFGTIAATLNDTSRELYPFVVGNNSETYRSAVLVAGETSEFPRSGSLTAPFASGVAQFPGAFLQFRHFHLSLTVFYTMLVVLLTIFSFLIFFF
jgi:hypothetical protein